MTTHELKSDVGNFQELLDGSRRCDIRLNSRNERDYEIGDTVMFVEWEPDSNEATGRSLERKITHVTRGMSCNAKSDGLLKSAVCLSLERVTP